MCRASQTFQRHLNAVQLTGSKMSVQDQLKAKALILLEGNDIASGLKWALYSNSVVMMQSPHVISWAMEDLLEPWVHYIPLNDNLTDVEEKIDWMIENDDIAEEIARNGKLWIHNLVFHPKAKQEDELIVDEMLRRYRKHFRSAQLSITSLSLF